MGVDLLLETVQVLMPFGMLQMRQLKDHFNNLLQKINKCALMCELTPLNSSTASSSKDIVQINNNTKNRRRSRKRRRVEKEMKNISKDEENEGSDDPTEDATTVEQLQRRVKRLERELARVVQINAEIYDYAANLTIEEENIIT
ncbi:hypothetical protein Mgra_00000176 [Meloidogyne graminicola]|uniref:Uncharacterized protein n=1 Tax=Meloidogyne graminicola TaxID=189291 RepID=A0A8T0A3D7_9BILA|nr:hypothetical protein Mgra_00000176 [Meloidogyne graminicola]